MNAFLLIMTVLGIFFQNIFQKQYAVKFGKIKNSNYIFSFIMAFSSLIMMAIGSLFGAQFDTSTLIYASAFGVFFSMATIFIMLSIKCGNLSLTALFISFSLIVPALYGIVFLGEDPSVFGIIGIVALLLSVVFINKYRKGEKVSLKWLIFVILAFLGNGLCSTVQKKYQVDFGGNNFGFMFIAMAVVSLITGVLFLFKRADNLKLILCKGSPFAAITGLLNGGVNILLLILAARLNASVMFPVVSGGGIILTFIIALTFFRERLSVIQYIGYCLGLASVILLSI